MVSEVDEHDDWNTQRVVNVVAPIAEEGGLAPMIAKPNPMRDLSA